MSLSKRNTTIVCSILIAIATCVLTPKSNAGIIHESATMGAINQWEVAYVIRSYQFIGTRFEITETTEITAIGGHLFTDDGWFIFGAIVSLDSSSDLPSGSPFWGSEVVTWTYMGPPYWSSDIRKPLSVILEPGWYGLVFGTGEFGSLNGNAESGMPYIGQSNLSGSTYFLWDGSGWYPTSFNPSSYPRFVVEGQPVIPPVEIYGTKFNDVDGDGFWDPGEPNMPGWELYLDENGNGTYEPSEPNVVTDSGGMYRFTDLDTPVTYRVREMAKDGWTQTMPGESNNYEYVIFAEPNNVYGPYDFGNTDQPVQTDIKLYGYAKTVNDDPISDARVETDPGSTSSGFDYTDQLGYYEITVLPPFTGSVSVSKTDWQQDTTSVEHTNLATDFQEDFVMLILGDLVGKNGVGVEDYAVLAGSWMNINAEINLSGPDIIDFRDLVVFIENYLEGR